MKEELERLINTLSEDSFRNLVVEYGKQKFKTPHVRIVDGPYDGGNDLEIQIGEKVIKKNIQVTVQKMNFESKLEKDLEKAVENVIERGYERKLDFYISQSIGKEKRDQLEFDAEVNHDMTLKIWDGKLLSEESKTYDSIRTAAYNGHNIDLKGEFVKADRNSKILFDVLTLNHNTVEIRKNLIHSLLFIYLNDNPNSNLDAIYYSLNELLNDSLDREYLFQQINYLKSQQQILSPSDDKSIFFLSENSTKKINEVRSNSELQELDLKELLSNFISDFKISASPEELVEHLKNMYYQNYQIEIKEVTSKSNSFDSSLKKSHSDLVTFFIKKGLSQNESENATKELLIRCEENEYLSKLGATLLFTNLYGSEQLENWVDNRKNRIVLDTQILIRLLVVLSVKKDIQNDEALESVKSLWNSLENSSAEIVTTQGYINEVAAHFLEAVKLERFLKLPYLDEFGRSKNVFFNAYKKFISNEAISSDTTLIEFIGILLGGTENVPDYLDNRFISIVSKNLIEIFEGLEFEILSRKEYDKVFYDAIKKSYETTISFTQRTRSELALKHDLEVVLFLTDESNHLDEFGQVNEPFLVSWDGAFYDFRKALFNSQSNPKSKMSYWYIYSPLKLVDRLAVLNFKVDPKAINHNIISLVEDNFNYSSKTTSFLDVLNSIFRKEDLAQIPLVNHFRTLKNSTQSTDTTEESPYEDEMPIVEVLLSIREYYSSQENKFSLEDLSEVLENPDLEKSIVDIIKEGIEGYPKKKQNIKELWPKLDLLINASKPS